MKSICFFSSYYSEESMPGYVKFYLCELRRHFSEVIFLTNEKTLDPDDEEFLGSNTIPYKLYKNEGYDFGMWYKAFQEYDLTNYDRVGLINDSCILFKKLDSFFEWADKNEIDYGGMTDCKLIEYHIQSYFIIINKKAIPLILKYFQQHGIIAEINQVIKVYEIGLSTYLVNSRMNVAALYSFKNDVSTLNPSWMKAKELIKSGAPLIKKRIFTRFYGNASLEYMIQYGFDPDPRNYIKLIDKVCPECNIRELTLGVLVPWGWRKEIKFSIHIYIIEFSFYIINRIRSIKGSILRILCNR